MSNVRRSTGVALMMALVLSIGARCVVAQEMTTAQMACCAGTDHDCGAAVEAPDCCRSEAAAQEPLAAKVQQVAFPPAPISRELADLFASPDTRSARGFTSDRQVIAESPPKYVLLATFLI